MCVPRGLCQSEQGTELRGLLAQRDGRNAPLPQASLGLQGAPYEQFPGCLQNAALLSLEQGRDAADAPCQGRVDRVLLCRALLRSQV